MQSIHCMFCVIYAVYGLHVCEKMDIEYWNYITTCYFNANSSIPQWGFWHNLEKSHLLLPMF